MSFWNIIPLPGEHAAAEDELRTRGSPPADEAPKDAFDHELSDKPQPYFPADEPDSADKQS